MTASESAFLFPCEGDELVGIISAPERDPGSIGVLVVVGGPQYRVGSHRQFVLLARDLAAAGIPCMRFDYRGMGDATGEMRQFDAIDADIGAAVDAFCARMPQLERIVLWGLCDGATASSFYAPSDSRVVGLVLLNPWVRTTAGEARTYLKHYYLQRMIDPSFWKKLLGGSVSIGDSLGGLMQMARTARREGPSAEQPAAAAADLPQRMAAALLRAGKPFCVVLSGNDYVAREFEQATTAGREWTSLPAARHPMRIEEADHTFSRAVWRREVARLTVDWVRNSVRGD